LARWGLHGLTLPHLQDTGLGLDPEHTCKHEREFIERGSLPRLLPSMRAVHTGDANLVRVSVYAADELFNAFRLVTDGRYDGWLLDQSCHPCLLMPYSVGLISRHGDAPSR
jgi:hypothetical protein